MGGLVQEKFGAERVAKRNDMTSREKIRTKALEVIDAHQAGIRYSELIRAVQEAYPEMPSNTIQGNLWNIDAVFPNRVIKPARGLFQAKKFGDAKAVQETKIAEAETASEIQEGNFYEPFAEWLTNELEECTKAIPLGGNRFKDKWGTPDVVGIREPRKSDIIKSPTEIVSAELKIDKAGLITAFGQACAYKIFSHRSYIVVPTDSAEEDVARLDILCRTLGVGLILFDATRPSDPRFEIRVRAARHEPDMFYVNRYMKLVEDELFS
jgi:hypothetical protein